MPKVINSCRPVSSRVYFIPAALKPLAVPSLGGRAAQNLLAVPSLGGPAAHKRSGGSLTRRPPNALQRRPGILRGL